MIGTDADVDRRLSAVAEIDVPFYAGLKIGVPSVPAIVDAIAEGRYDLVHVCSPGPGGRRRLAAGAAARAAAGRQLPHRAGGLRRPALGPGSRSRRSPATRSASSTAPATRCSRRARRRDAAAASSSGSRPARSAAGTAASTSSASTRRCATGRCCPSAINVLYAGRLTKEKGVELLADAFEAARAREPRLHLVLAGGGPEEDALRERLGEHATFLGWQHGAGSGPRLRERRRVPVRQPDRHLRPGGARGAGERAAGGRGRRGRPAVADRARRDGPAGAGRRRPRWPTRCCRS